MMVVLGSDDGQSTSSPCFETANSTKAFLKPCASQLGIIVRCANELGWQTFPETKLQLQGSEESISSAPVIQHDYGSVCGRYLHRVAKYAGGTASGDTLESVLPGSSGHVRPQAPQHRARRIRGNCRLRTCTGLPICISAVPQNTRSGHMSSNTFTNTSH